MASTSHSTVKKAVNRSVFEYVNYSLKGEINSGN